MAANIDKRKNDLKLAIQTTTQEAWFCDHVNDNTWVRASVDDTVNHLDYYGLTPISLCLHPSYRPDSGYALIVLDQNGTTQWVHVPYAIMVLWLKTFDLMPPDTMLWDRDTVEKWVWNHENVE